MKADVRVIFNGPIAPPAYWFSGSRRKALGKSILT
jgi:hypothetical protein